MAVLNRRSLLGAFLVLPTAGAFGAAPMEFRCRFRIKAVMEAADGVHTAASVIEVLWIKSDPGFTGVRFTKQVWGEAPYGNVKGIGAVFVLLNPPFTYVGFSISDIDKTLGRHVRSELTTGEAIEDGRYLSAMTSLKGEYFVPEKRWPRLMAFSDKANLGSGRLVDNGGTSEVKIREVSLAVTRTPVTHSIEDVLPWLRQEMPLPQLGKVAPGEIPLVYRVRKTCFLLNGKYP